MERYVNKKRSVGAKRSCIIINRLSQRWCEYYIADSWVLIAFFYHINFTGDLYERKKAKSES